MVSSASHDVEDHGERVLTVGVVAVQTARRRSVHVDHLTSAYSTLSTVIERGAPR